MRGLYVIVDTGALGARGLDPVRFAAAVLAARPAALQLRAKGLGAGETLALLRRLVPLCDAAGVPCFANDRPDLAVLASCAGVHVGQHDLAVADVRRFAPALRVGVSTHGSAELEQALAARPDYVAFGPVFATGSKERAEPVVGEGALPAAAAACRAAGVPLLAIGGLDAERLRRVAPHVELAAVIGALLPAADELSAWEAAVTARARELAAALG